jgi:pilus assembly protein CpaB
MARIRVFVVLAIALTAGGALALATYNYVQSAPAATPAAPAAMATKPVVVASADLELGAELRAEDVRVVQWPANAVPANTFSDPKEVVGRGLVAPVVQNEPLLALKLASEEAGAGLTPVIPPGLRAVSVRVNEVIGVAGYVLPGTRVDIVATVSPSRNAQDMTAKVILTDVQVVAAGTKIERNTENDKPMPVNVVTLLVNPEEAERLTLASNEGKIQLALRNPLDRGTPATRGVKPAALVASAPPVRQVSTRRLPTATTATAAAGPAANYPTVEIIRGDKRAHEVVRGQE